MKKILLSAILIISFTACQNTNSIKPLNTNSDIATNSIKQKAKYSVSGEFQYREMVTNEDINIYQVARRFLWDYDLKDVNNFHLNKLIDNVDGSRLALRKYEINFYGDNKVILEKVLKDWQEKFKKFQ